MRSILLSLAIVANIIATTDANNVPPEGPKDNQQDALEERMQERKGEINTKECNTECGKWKETGQTEPQPWIANIVDIKKAASFTEEDVYVGTQIGLKVVVTDNGIKGEFKITDVYQVNLGGTKTLTNKDLFYDTEQVKIMSNKDFPGDHKIEHKHVVLLILKKEVHHKGAMPICFPPQGFVYEETINLSYYAIALKGVKVDLEPKIEPEIVPISKGAITTFGNSRSSQSKNEQIVKGAPVSYQNEEGDFVLVGIADMFHVSPDGLQSGFLEVYNDNIRKWIVKEADLNCISYEPKKASITTHG